jgi:transcription initiation factor TFIIH subunit 2
LCLVYTHKSLLLLLRDSHSKLIRGGYPCPRCSAKVCSLPIECPVCGLTLILSTHLARSYHHLFPLRNWPELPYSEFGPLIEPQANLRNIKSTNCYGCQAVFPPLKRPQPSSNNNIITEGPSQTQRFACPSCHNHFCIDCDLFCHEVLHNCPGCERLSPGVGGGGTNKTQNGQAVNGESLSIDSDPMIID